MVVQNAINKFSFALGNFYVPNCGGGFTLTVAPVAGQVVCAPFTLENKIVVTGLAFRVATLYAGGHASVGIYSSDGTSLLVDSGPILTTTTGAKTKTGLSVALSAGTYIAAWTADNTTCRLYLYDCGDHHSLVNAEAVRMGTANNGSTAGQLQSSTGVITDVAIGGGALMLLSAE